MSARVAVLAPAIAAVSSAVCMARAKLDVFILMVLDCPGSAAEATCFIRTLEAHGRSRRLRAAQARVRGGWSGGGRLSPATSTSSWSECTVRTGWRIDRAAEVGGPDCTVLRMQIAISGQS